MKKRKRSQADKDAAHAIDKQTMRARQHAAFIRNGVIATQGPMHEGDIIGGFAPLPPDEETRRVFCCRRPLPRPLCTRGHARGALARAMPRAHATAISAALRRAMLGDS